MVDTKMTAAPSQVHLLGMSLNTSQPKREAQTKSKNRRDWVAEISATLKAFVKL
jgi:hypothetical protein